MGVYVFFVFKRILYVYFMLGFRVFSGVGVVFVFEFIGLVFV